MNDLVVLGPLKPRKPWMTLIVIGIVLVVLAMAGFWMKNASASQIDVVKGVPPVSTAFKVSMGEAQTALKGMKTAEERGRYLEANFPNLDEALIVFLREHNKIVKGDKGIRVDFKFGSMDKVLAETGDNKQVKGYFRDQLVAVVSVAGKKPFAVIVECLNGTFALPEELNRLQAVGSHTPETVFVIQKNEGLIHHVNYAAAIELAERHNLPLYRGVYRGKATRDRYKITPDQARELEPSTDWQQVTVEVYPGDRFDLVNGTFTPSPNRPTNS